MLRRYVGLLALGVTPVLIAAACSSDEDGSPAAPKNDGGGTDGEAGPSPGPGIQPPATPSGPTTAGGNETTLAMSEIYIGDSTRSGTVSTQAWKDFGYDLDGLISSKDSQDHCTPPQGGNPGIVKTDGTNGIDNAFGASLIPIIQTLLPKAGAELNAALDNGDFTVIIKAALGPESETTGTGIPTTMHAGARFGSLITACDITTPPTTPLDPQCVPKWDGTDVWPLAPIGNSTDPITVNFSESFMVNGTWVSGSKGNLDLTIAILDVQFTLRIIEAVLTMDVTGRGASATATNGVIAGLINTEELIEELRGAACTIDCSICGSVFDSIAVQIRGGSDIMVDGTNGDPSKTCNAISIGLGFDATAVTVGAVAPPVPPPVDICADQ